MDDYEEKINDMVFERGSAVVEQGFIYYDYGKWYRSKERKDTGYSPFGSYMINKKWTMEEEFTNHVMRFQQV